MFLAGFGEEEMEAGYLRIAAVTSGTGPQNDMAYIGTEDGGVNWEPALGGSDYLNKDVPIVLEGDISNVVNDPVLRVESIDITLGLALGGLEESGAGRAKVRGGGE